jgi:hypothetical protein
MCLPNEAASQPKDGFQMKTLLMTLLLALATSAMAAESEPGPDNDRYVADAIEIVTLPDGKVVTRLVSRSGITARQFWVDSVYGNQASILVFQGKGGVIQDAIAAPVAQKSERHTTRHDREPSDRIDLETQALDGRYKLHDERDHTLNIKDVVDEHGRCRNASQE